MSDRERRDSYGEVIDAIFEGRMAEARMLLLRSAERGLEDHRWWIWMSAAAESPVAALAALRNAERQDPANPLVQAGRAWIEGLLTAGESQQDPRIGRSEEATHPNESEDDSFAFPDVSENDGFLVGRPTSLMNHMRLPTVPEPVSEMPETTVFPPPTVKNVGNDRSGRGSRVPEPFRILVVDTCPTVASEVDRSLRVWGYEVLSALDSIEAVQMARREQPGLILVNLEMPRVDGYRLCKLLKSLEETRRIPVILVHEPGLEIDAERCRLVGAIEVISKPLLPETLIREVDQVIRAVG